MVSARAESLDTRIVILENALPLFAEKGFTGVSMRDIARAVGISAAALYHHFPDKHSLYMDTVQHAFADISQGFVDALRADVPAEKRLERYVRTLARQVSGNPVLRRFHQRMMLEGDEDMLKIMSTRIFKDQYQAATDLARELAPGADAHMLVFSISGLVVHHFDMASLRRCFRGHRKQHEDVDYIVDHVCSLLLNGLKGMAKPQPKRQKSKR